MIRVLGVGEVLWDLFPEEETFGGAPLNFCANLQRLGDEALLVSAVGSDSRGAKALKKMEQLGLGTGGIETSPRLPTGVALIENLPDTTCSFTIPRPAAFDDLNFAPEILEKVRVNAFDWIYFGTLLQTQGRIETMRLSP